MQSHPKSVHPQLNLALLDRAPTGLPQDQQRELALALVELLVNAAARGAGVPAGGPNESEAHE